MMRMIMTRMRTWSDEIVIVSCSLSKTSNGLISFGAENCEIKGIAGPQVSAPEDQETWTSARHDGTRQEFTS
jgi:hypothetical protein